jgi:hypothetical protein
MDVTREVKLLGYIALAAIAVRTVVLLVDAIAEAAERRALYR